MDERVGLVFSWDPRAQHWLKERGPEDAPPPPADPIDNEAVQTYYLDTATGRWSGTILGLKGRQISVELGDKYRAAKMVGLAIIPKAAPKTVYAPGQKKSPVPMMAGIAAVVVVIAAGAFAAQAVMQPKDATTGSAAPTVAVVSGDPTAAPSEAATPAPTSAPTQGPGRTPQPTVAPTVAPPPPQTVAFSARMTTGQTVTYSSPGSVVQGTALDGVVSLRTPNGAPGSEPITLYVGPLGTAQALTLNPDRNGNYVFTLKINIAKGTAPISVSVGKNGEIRTIGTITVR